MIGTKEENRKLIDACNLLCEFVSDHLPTGWEICLDMAREESTATLVDPDGEDVETDSGDSGTSTFSEMCEWAIESDSDDRTKNEKE